MIDAKTIHEQMMQDDPEYAREYDALEEEFGVIRKMIQADGQETLIERVLKRMYQNQRILSMQNNPFFDMEKDAIRNICEYSTIYFEWATENLDLMVDILTSCKIFLHNSDEFNDSYFNELNEFMDISCQVSKLKRKVIDKKNRSYMLDGYYISILKKISELEEDVNSKANIFTKRCADRDNSNFESNYVEDYLNREETLIYWLAKTYERHYANMKNIEEDFINFPLCRENIKTKQLSPVDVQYYTYDDGKFVKDGSMEYGPHGSNYKLQFFTGDFFFLIWGVYTALDIPKRKQKRKTDGDDFFNKAADSEAFAKKILRALDKCKAIYFRLLDVGQNTN